MHSRNTDQITDHYLYLSTPVAEAFEVRISNGAGALLATPVISAGNPFIYEIAPDDPSVLMINSEDLNKPLTDRGLIVSAPERFYCNFRGRSNLQATSITCKGNAARGTTFRIGVLPQQFEHFMRNFTASVMATEDNTIINVSNYDNEVEFFDLDGNILLDELNFVLDSGESYVVSGYNDIAANLDGFVGALVTSDKPIVLNNGSWCGSIADAGGQDIGMDQSVPIEVLGTEYILIRGDGDAQMERPLVIAHTNATSIFVNGEPEAIATINAGEYFLIPEMHYTGIDHENMYVETSNPTYVYQPLGGSPSRATPGLNFIPPISCSMTKEIDLIPSIDQIGATNYNGAIICFTLAGATVSVNGVPQAGAEPVVGAPEWETYRIEGVEGDVRLTSTDRMAAGTFGFSGDAGFAGFYSGFDPIGFADYTFTESCELTPSNFTDETVTFAEEIIGRSWDFADGGTSFDTDPIHTFAEAGTYEVVLEVTTNLGCTDAVSYPVTVLEAPIADFEFMDICLNQSAVFIDSSSFDEGIITDWNWDFGDLTTSTLMSPTNEYTTFGTFLVSLAVTGENGCISTITKTIDVFDNPIANFNALASCFYDSVTFENLSTIEDGEIILFDWEFGDGFGTSAMEEPEYLYAESGTYNVSLSIISDKGCLSDTLIPLKRFAAPNASYEAENNCLNDLSIFNNTSSIEVPAVIDSYLWDFGDGMISELVSPTHLFDAAGVYPIVLNVISTDGCVDSITQMLTIYDTPIANFTAENDCFYTNVDFENLSSVSDGVIASNLWNFDDGVESDLFSPSHLFDVHGFYNVNLSVTSEFGCNNDTTITIERFASPTIEFDAPNSCLSETITFENTSTIPLPYEIAFYEWNFGDGVTATSEDPVHSYSEPGTYLVVLKATSAEGCFAEETIPLSIYPVPVVNFSSLPTCFGNESDFINETTLFWGDVISWQWDFSDGTTSVEENPTHTFSTVGEHIVQLIATSNHNCTDSIIAPITIQPLPIVSLNVSDSILCGNECITLNSSSSSESTLINYEWETSFGHLISGESVEICFESFGNETQYFDLSLKVTDEFGCMDKLLLNDFINVLPTPKASFTINPNEVSILDTQVDFFNTSSFATDYLWDFGDGSSNSIEFNPIHLYEIEPGRHEITLYAFSDPTKQCVDTARQILEIKDELIYYVPNAFTPDGNSFNNDFSPVFTTGFDPYNYHLSIYNRYGEVLFESYNSTVGWDGTNRNYGLVQDGVYVWKIEFKERSTGKSHSDIGHVTLLK